MIEECFALFSVVIPAYNCESTIEEALDSVVRQTRADLIEEIIIINDGSVDNTDIVIKEYISNNHSNISFIYISQKNAGVSVTRNRGIKMAKGEWIALLDSDDVWMPTKLERQNTIIQTHPEIVFLGCEYPGHKGMKAFYEGVIKLTPMDLCVRYTPTTPSVIFRKETGIELGLFDEERAYCEDIGFFQKFMLRDSYYILCENLVKIDIGKVAYGEKGLSSNLLKMHKGRDANTIEMYRLHLIYWHQMVIMLAFNQIKFLRRFILSYMSKRKRYR